MVQTKEAICTAAGIVGAAITAALGGWTASLTALVIFMAIDYATGLVCAGVFHKSQKTESGALESRTCLKGLVRKCMILLLVLLAHQLDVVIGTTYVKDAVCIAFISSEAISITENAGLMGVPMPSAITKALEILQKQKN